MGDRTEMQKSANRFDCDLYRLLSGASNFATSGPREYRAKWDHIAAILHEARPLVRLMMHRDDLKGTVG